MSRKRWRVVVPSVVAVGLLLVLGVGAWRVLVEGEADSRAYPGSHSRSLDQMLDHYHIELPDCAQSSLRFARFNRHFSDSFYLYFTAGDDCLLEFLAGNGLEDEETYRQRGLPFRPGDGPEFGWPRDPREYVALDGTLTSSSGASLVAVEIAIDYSTSPRSLYLWAGTV